LILGGNNRKLLELAQLPDINPGPVFRIDRSGTIVLANRAARSVFRDEKLVGKTWVDICPDMSRDEWTMIWNGGGSSQCEVERSGLCISLTFILPAIDGDMYVFGADITTRKRAEERLAQQKILLAELARFPEMNPGPVIRTDLDGYVIMGNASARGLFGESVVGMCWKNILPGFDEATWSRILSSGEPVPVEACVVGEDYLFTHRRDKGGPFVFVFGADVTVQKRTERALRQSEKMATLGTLSAGVAHELNNPAAAVVRTTGHLRDAIVRLEKAHIRLSSITLTPAAREVLDRLEEKARSVSVRVDPLDPLSRADAEAEIEEWLEGHDIPEAWNLAPPLAATETTISDLDRIAGIIPGEALASVLEWTAVIFPVYILLSDIGKGSGRISEIVSALKHYSYLGQAPVQRVKVHEGLDETLVIMRFKLNKGVTVTKEYSSDMPAVEAYGSELNQAWTNLIDNAVDAMNGKGELHIRTRRDGARAVVEIEDNGPGIPEDVQARIFDPFFTTKEPGKGTGLGLATTYSIITEKHRGDISVDSSPGRTRFTVRLPLDGPGTSQIPEPPEVSAPPSPTKKKEPS